MNPLVAAVKGTSKTVKDATESTIRSAKEAVISPSVAYSLGMGIGPWLRNVANASDKKDDKRDKKDQSSGLAKKEFTLLSSQFNTMVSILRDIRNIGMIQLRADQQRLLEARRQEYFSKEAASESSGIMGAALTATGGKKDSGSSLAILGNMLPDILKLMLAGGAAYGIWNYVFDDKSRQKIKEALFGDDAGKKGIWTIIADKYVEVLKSNPVETALGTLIAARVTGVLAGLGYAGKFMYHGGKIIAQTAGAAGNVMHGGKDGRPGGGRAGLQAAVELAELNQLNKMNAPTAVPPAATATQIATTGMSAAERLKYNRLMRAEVASNNAAASAAAEAAAKASAEAAKQGTSILTKLGPLMRVSGRVLSGGLLGIGTGLSAMSAKEDYDQGKSWSAWLNGISAVTGAGALGTMFIPGAQPISGGLAVASALTGMAGAVTSYFETGKDGKSKLPEQYHGASGPLPSGTQQFSSSDLDQKYGWSEEDWAKLGNLVGSKESGAEGYGAIEKKNGNYIGRYQFGAEALIDVGLMKREAKKDGTRGIWKKENWVGGLSAEAFLASPELQERAFRDYHRKNLAVLQQQGLINSHTVKKDIAAALMASQFGVGNASNFLRGRGDFRDANGTAISSYYSFARNSFDSASSTPGAAQTYAGGIVPGAVSSPGASSGGVLSEMTELANDLTRMFAGGMMLASNDKNTTINQANVTGGGSPSPRLDISGIQNAVSHVGM